MKTPLRKTFELLLCVALCMAVPFSLRAHGSASLHNRDLSLLLGGYNKSPLGDIARRISSSHDNEWAEWFRKEIGPIPGNHRVIGHGAPLGMAIPEEFLAAVKKRYGMEGVRKVIAKQRELSIRYRDEIMRATGLGKKESRALLRLFSVLHLAGDHTPDNKLVNLVMKFTDQCEVGKDVVERLLRKKNPQYADMVLRKIDAIGKLPKSSQALAYVKLWATVRFDDALKNAYGNKLAANGCRYDIDAAIRRNELLKSKYSSGNPYEKKPSVGKVGGSELASWRSTFARAGFWSGMVLLRDVVKGDVGEGTWLDVSKSAGREAGLELAGRLVALTIGKKLAESELRGLGVRLTKKKISELAMKKSAQLVGGGVMIVMGAIEAGEFINRYNEGEITMGEMNAQVTIVAVATGTAVFFTCTEKGAEIGAAIGSVIPGAGNVSGAAIGCVIGVAAGVIGGVASGGVSYYFGSQKAKWYGQKQDHYLAWIHNANEKEWAEKMATARARAVRNVENGWASFGHKQGSE